MGSFRARADVVEYLGNEELLHVNAADQDIVAIVDSEHRVRPGDIVNLVLPLDKLHLFDGETGLTLAPGRRRSSPERPTATDDDASAPGDSSGADLVERVVDSRVVHRGRYLTFRVDTIERADGSRGTRDIVGHPGAVAILAIDDEDRVLLVRQYRVAVGEALLEIPAGTLDVAGRRLDRGSRAAPRRASSRRRPGCAPGRGGSIASFYTAPGFASELMHLYLATDLRPADGERLGPDEDEHLLLERMPWRDAVAAAERGELRDAQDDPRRCSGWRACVTA